MILPACPSKRLTGRFGTCLEFLGDRVCPCCNQLTRNVWAFSLQHALETIER